MSVFGLDYKHCDIDNDKEFDNRLCLIEEMATWQVWADLDEFEKIWPHDGLGRHLWNKFHRNNHDMLSLWRLIDDSHKIKLGHHLSKDMYRRLKLKTAKEPW
jgi:hypothetical protein